MRLISFRHEQNAGQAAAIAGFLTKKPGVCLTVSAPGFLNGLVALANATTNCFPMIQISGSSEREVVDLQQGDYEEMDQLRSEEHTSEIQSLMRISYAVFCLQKKKLKQNTIHNYI